MQHLGEEAAGHGHCRASLLLPLPEAPIPRPTPRLTVGSDSVGSCGHGVLEAAVWAPASTVPSARVVPSARALRKQDRMWVARAGSPEGCPVRTGLMWGHREAEPAPGKSPAVRGRDCSIEESHRHHQHLLWSQPCSSPISAHCNPSLDITVNPRPSTSTSTSPSPCYSLISANFSPCFCPRNSSAPIPVPVLSSPSASPVPVSVPAQSQSQCQPSPVPAPPRRGRNSHPSDPGGVSDTGKRRGAERGRGGGRSTASCHGQRGQEGEEGAWGWGWGPGGGQEGGSG